MAIKSGLDRKMTKREDLLAALVAHGQEHVLAFWDRLNAAQRESLAGQIRAVDLDLIDRLYRGRGDQGDIRLLADRAEPPPAIRLNSAHNPFTPETARRRGRQALDAGQVGAVLVAGGQGTRLGFDHPKGMFPIGPVSGRTLFQIHVEKILAAGRRHGVRIPLYLMTSPTTHKETVEFFARHNRLGLTEEDLYIFCQGTMPAIDAQTGKLLLAAPDRLATSPDGHGGMLAAFAASGGLDDARRRGIRQLFYFQVDNPLVDICGDESVGYHLLCESEMTTQVIAKREPLERVGNVATVDGRLMVIEYSDLPDEVARRKNPDGSLVLWAGSIAVHVFDLALLERMAGSAGALPFHYANKRAAYVDAAGRPVEPSEPNAIKFERFIFDLMPAARGAVVVEVDPAKAFAPLKNGAGAKQDTSETVKAQMTDQHRQWLRRAGVEVTDGVAVEISPWFALDAEDVARKVRPGTRIVAPTYIEEQGP
jgi:UDP-N-acetylglucosamine/UDP-N-acetylgalactosamine diphosphorylase